MVWRWALLLGLGLWPALGLAAGVVYDIAQGTVRDRAPVVGSPGGTPRVERLPAGGLRLTIRGAAGARCRFYLPIGTTFEAAGSVTYRLATTNVVPASDQPAVWLELGEPSGVTRLTLLTALGPAQQEVGERSFGAPGAAVAVQGLGVEFAVQTAGEASLTIEQLQVLVASNYLSPEALAAALAEPPPVAARLLPTMGGRLLPQVDGRLLPGLGYAGGAYHRQAKYEALVRQGGVAWLRVPLNLGAARGRAATWPPLLPWAGYVDEAALAAQLAPAEASGAWLWLELVLAAPPSWYEGPVSDADPAWQAWQTGALEQVLARVRRHPAGARVFAVSLSVGETLNGTPWPGRAAVPAYQEGFRTWLATQYPEVSALRHAWGKESLTRESAEALTEAVPPTTPDGLRLPGQHRRAWDSYEYALLSWTQSLLKLAEVVKNRSFGRWLVGLPGGPAGLFATTSGSRADWPGSAVRELLASPHVDVLEVQADTVDLRPEWGTAGGELLLAQAAARQQKLLLVRCQFSTHLARRQGYEALNDADATVQVVRRAFAAALQQQALFELQQTDSQGYAASSLLPEVQQLAAIAGRATQLDLAQEAQVAFVYDPDTTMEGQFAEVAGTPVASPALLLLDWPRSSWPRLGAPYDVVRIDRLEPERYKLLVFYQILRLEGSRKALLDRCRGGGRTLVWTWGAGALAELAASPDSMVATVGLDLVRRQARTRFFLRPTVAMRSELGIDRIAGYLGWGIGYRQASFAQAWRSTPQFVVRDGEATILAHYADEPTLPALALREFPGWTAVYSASPYLNPELLQALARRSGVHLYLETTDWCQVNRSLVAIHAQGEGVRTLRLPQAEPLYEVVRRQELPVMKEHRVRLQAGKTYLFHRGTPASWQPPTP